MTNPSDFDPARAIRQQRDAEEATKQREEVERQRAKAQRDEHRVKVLKLLRYADEQLENIRNPVVSEFVVDERWWTPESEQISDKREPDEFRRTLRTNQRIAGYEGDVKLFRPTRYIYTIVTSHRHRSQTRYYGSWLSLDITRGVLSERQGLVKLRQPHAGYAFVRLGGWAPHTKDHIPINLTDHHGRKIHPSSTGPGGINQYFRLYKSLAPVIADSYSSVERLTKHVTQALDFVETGQPPEPEWIEAPPEPYSGDH